MSLSHSMMKTPSAVPSLSMVGAGGERHHSPLLTPQRQPPSLSFLSPLNDPLSGVESLVDFPFS